MLIVGRKRKGKERKKDKKHTNSIARIRARASRPAVSFACLKLHHAAKTSMADFRDVVSVLPAARLIKASRSLWLNKKLIDR